MNEWMESLMGYGKQGTLHTQGLFHLIGRICQHSVHISVSPFFPALCS